MTRFKVNRKSPSPQWLTKITKSVSQINQLLDQVTSPTTTCAFANSWNYISATFDLFFGLPALFIGPPNSAKRAYRCIFGFHSTIYIFKNYFATVFSVINFQFSTNKRYLNGLYNSNKIVKNNNPHKHENSAIIHGKHIVVKIIHYVISSHILFQIIRSKKFFYFCCCLPSLKHSPLDSESFHCSNGIEFIASCRSKWAFTHFVQNK